jgi:hypothetical protein
MIAIVNIDDNVRASGRHKYELRINNRVIATFYHDREKPLHECLLEAAIASESKTKPCKKGLIRPLFEPRYDDVYLEGLRWLSSL